MQTRILSLAIATAIFTFVSCNKENESEEKFSPLSVEENKANIEEAGIDMVNEVSALSNTDAIAVIVEFAGLLDEQDPFEEKSVQIQKISATLDAVSKLREDPTSTSGVFKAMKSAYELSEDPESIQEIWEMLIGVYDWNSTTETWDYTEEGDEAIFNFPSSESSTSNDASFTIHSYTGVVIESPLNEEYTGDLPTALNADLKVGGTVLVSYLFAASYNNDGIPSSIASDLTIADFKFEIDITNTSSQISADAKLTHGETVIIDLGAGIKGDFTQENIDENTHPYIADYEYNPGTGNYDPVYEDELDVEEVINSANAHFRIMNLAIKGDIDAKSLFDKEEEIYAGDTTESFNYEEADGLMVDEINKYLNLRLVYEDTNEILAKVEAYVRTEDGDSWIDLRFVFGDDSKVDPGTYFGEGFDDFIDAVNDLIDDLNEDYDLDIEYVEM